MSRRPTAQARRILLLGILLFTLLPLPVLAAELRGTVIDATGAPIAGAEITIVDPPRSTRSADDGGFAFSGLDTGELEIRIVREGFALVKRVVMMAESAPVSIEVRLLPIVATETITVSSGYSMLGRSTDNGIAMGKDAIEKLPHFADDLYRAIGALPSTTANDVSSKFSIRGGLARENLVLLDGLEIFEPYHLKDYEGALSIFDPSIIGGASLYPGAFPAQFGDRSSGVLDMDVVTPDETVTSVGASLSTFWFRSAGRFPSGNGSWVASVRRGYLDIVMDLAGANDDEGEEESPAYLDAFGRVNWWITPKQNLAFNVLFADDTLSLQEKEDQEDITAETSYGNWYVWATHRAFPTPKLSARTVLAISHLDRDRDSRGIDHDDTFTIRDIRDTDLLTFKQDWTYTRSPRLSFNWGYEARKYDVAYDYQSTALIGRSFDDPRFRDPMGAVDYAAKFKSEYYGAYLSSRYQPTERFAAELGLRYDKTTLTKEDDIGPRVNLRWNLGEKSNLSLGWGQVSQSHRPSELDVQDGEQGFMPLERATHYVLGYETALAGGWGLRAEAYQRETDNPRVRYETLFDPLGQFPEAAYDRVPISATSATSRGLELFVRGPKRQRWDWWASYVYSETFDEVDGREQKRPFDQPHALTFNLNYKPGPRWNFNALWLFHTGWPTTNVRAEIVEGSQGPELVPIVGAFYDERLPAYHRLDMRASYTRNLRRRGKLVFFVDIQNLYGRKNASGFEFDDGSFLVQPDGSVRVMPEQEEWLGVMPSFGISWEF